MLSKSSITPPKAAKRNKAFVPLVGTNAFLWEKRSNSRQYEKASPSGEAFFFCPVMKNYLPVILRKKNTNPTIIAAITPTMTQKAVVLVMNGKSTFMPNKLATTVSGSMMVEK